MQDAYEMRSLEWAFRLRPASWFGLEPNRLIILELKDLSNSWPLPDPGTLRSAVMAVRETHITPFIGVTSKRPDRRALPDRSGSAAPWLDALDAGHGLWLVNGDDSVQKTSSS